ncbi:class I SAM-dependent methyltransferase [Rhizobium oryziradicis]|uniref:Methyltransferase type 11 n=1 Tax=Rhizobium oryziradicis TaxID=1867956 RepID=A0A1Q8ZWL5_9HYPH|nr:class I SAM-dependent methyltransferase [Rhizobium oryziradicis]OLP46442.1 methyltransferase type 11 [Rhizobium oryziradicis]
MSGFDSTWLALREPADRAARAPVLVAQLSRHLATVNAPRVLDIGCGTGSTWRSLANALPDSVGWTLLDHDPALLDEAKKRMGERENIQFYQHDLTDVDGLPLKDVTLVTASALFDLCSDAFCAALSARLAMQSCGLYAALNYNGVMTWTLSLPLDAQVLADFNHHQRTDKGFGAALGPDATDCLHHHLAAHGFQLSCQSSPWRMDAGMKELQIAFLKGLRHPLIEIGNLSPAQIDQWILERISLIDARDSLCEVGHTDLIALPD